MGVKYVRLKYYRFYGFQFPNLFQTQGLTHLVEQKGCIYPDLIRVFYHNLRYHDDIVTSEVKGVSIILDDNIWTNVAKLTIWDDAVKVHLDIPNFNRLLAYQSFLRNPQQQSNQRQLLVEIRETTLRQMGFVARGNVFLYKDEENQSDEDDDEDAHMAEPVREAAPSTDGTSSIPTSSTFSMEEYFVNLSKQMEDMSLAHQARFDEIIEM
ncbi:hypothetical protein LR48_Vigan08g080400 [Vigna angularis]|uniref:Uncharacterized protein n=1 Tax=Phaseolus angularis TaxID=3914 RepID=A0A0L9V4U9_PHAAN|nr:hypothetical protein LR48_Vigan08g080400 [Vigna angularis]